MTETKTDSPINQNDSISYLISESEISSPDTTFSDDSKDYNHVKKCLTEYYLFNTFLKALKVVSEDFRSFYNLRLAIFQTLNQCVVAGCTEWSMHSAGFDK